MSTWDLLEVHHGASFVPIFKPKSISAQNIVLRQYFPEIGPVEDRTETRELSQDINWYSIPKWERLAPTYGEAVIKALKVIQKFVRLCNLYEKDLRYSGNFRQSEDGIKAFHIIGNEHGNDNVFNVPAQIVCHDEDYSISQVPKFMSGYEFDIGVFAFAIIVITHYECLNYKINDFWRVYCPGDSFTFCNGPNMTPFLQFSAGHGYGSADIVELGMKDIKDVPYVYWTGSGFIP